MLPITLPPGGSTYRLLADAIRLNIIRGTINPGEKLPAVRQAAMQWHLSAGTVQRAYELLANERYVITKLGAQGGTYVAENAPRTSGDDYATANAVGRIYGGTRKAVIMSAEVIPATEEVARMLDLQPGDPVIRRERVTFPNTPEPAKPLSVSISYHDAELLEQAPLLTDTRRIPQGTPRYIQEQTGYVGTEVVDMVSADSLSEYMAARLDLPPGTPVLKLRTVFRAQDGYVVEYGVCLTPPGEERVYRYSVE